MISPYHTDLLIRHTKLWHSLVERKVKNNSPCHNTRCLQDVSLNSLTLVHSAKSPSNTPVSFTSCSSSFSWHVYTWQCTAASSLLTALLTTYTDEGTLSTILTYCVVLYTLSDKPCFPAKMFLRLLLDVPGEETAFWSRPPAFALHETIF